MEVQIFANSQLGGERELAESMQLGTLDIAIIPGVIGNFSDEVAVLDMPYLFESKEHAYKVLDGEVGKKLAENLPATSGFRLLSYWENGYRNMTNSRREIKTPGDVAGLTMRVPENSVYQAFFEELGANVVAISFSELYISLSQKTVDGQENPVALIATNKLYETQPYLVMFVIATSGAFSWLLVSQRIPNMMAEAILSVMSNKYAILMVVNLLLLVLGVFLETNAIILMITPMLLPIAAQIGVSYLELGIIMVVNTSVGMLTPPMALNILIASGIGKVSIERVARQVVPFLIALIIDIMIITYIPGIIEFIPRALNML